MQIKRAVLKYVKKGKEPYKVIVTNIQIYSFKDKDTAQYYLDVWKKSEGK